MIDGHKVATRNGSWQYIHILNGNVDWNLLMEVVEKIEKLDNADAVVNIQETTCAIGGGDFEIVVNEYDKLQSVRKACLKFITWYNRAFPQKQ